ncbi:hypothetical protein [Lentibacter sp.]|uniref:hypothetical protein n=1 Tax=Lentibacter sp. TaxID=2024994 RepID=UPI003F6BCF03
MPVTYEILESPNVVMAHYRGVVRIEDIIAMFESYQAAPEFELRRPHIADLRTVDISSVGFNEVYTLFSMFGRRYAEAGVPMRVAIVADSEVVFGMSRIFENLTEQSHWAQTCIFCSMSEAKAWVTQA